MTTAYSRIDRFLRENLNDNDYPAYKEELDALCQAKAQRIWVGLTDEELHEICNSLDYYGDRGLVQLIESKLKEKNNA